MTAELAGPGLAGARAELTSDEFRGIFRNHPAAVTVVALLDGGRPVGFTATSVISVAAAPPTLAFSLPTSSSSWAALSRADTVAISFLADDQAHVSARFATSGIDRFADGGWSVLPTGEPVIDGATAWVQGPVTQRVAVGESRLVIVRVRASAVRDDARPLVYHDRRYRRLGLGA